MGCEMPWIHVTLIGVGLVELPRLPLALALKRAFACAFAFPLYLCLFTTLSAGETRDNPV